MNGQRTLTWADGANTRGMESNNMNGQGTYTYPNGKKKRGYYMNDEYVPDICEDMGLSKGTSGFEQCVLKLIDKL